ncbi:hypothetical protein HMPREF1619_01760 [Klebsiella pneumoniae 909957]|nr:hypothetical protein HMPREF1619_01760 [Klebsiella pneumoniae 909957]
MEYRRNHWRTVLTARAINLRISSPGEYLSHCFNGILVMRYLR